jgi:hypothetical protein
VKNSKFLKLNIFDFIKGLMVTIVIAILTALLQMLTNNPPLIDYSQICIVAISAGISYLLKKLSTNSNGELFKSENE